VVGLALRNLAAEVRSVDVLRRAGLLEPGLAAATVAAAARWGASLAVPYAAAAARYPDRPAIVDREGVWTYRELAERTDAVAARWQATDPPAERVGILAHNSVWFVAALLAATKAGLPTVLLNTGSSGPQLATVVEREGIDLLLTDGEGLPPVGPGSAPVTTLGIAELFAGAGGPTSRVRSDFRRPAPMPVLLTSGTTGAPRGARRDRPRPGPATATAILERIPLRRGDVFVVPAPLFHAWGLAHLLLAATLAGTVVIDGEFDADRTLGLVERERADVLVVVPVMLQRLLAALPASGASLASLRVVASSGSALAGPLATRWMDAAGDNLYNLYGSTEAGHVSIATPADLRASPGTAGRAAAGVTLRILDPDGRPVATGRPGRVAVRSSLRFDGYTGGATAEHLDGWLLTGDLGRLDDAGRLLVLGRVDDMIVSGGENVYPSEVEDLLAGRDDIAEVAVVGVADDEFGERLLATVVPEAGAALDPEEIRAYVGARRSRHEVPREVVVAAELPRNTTGKVLRNRLREDPR
jgi:acyl-CoA synthetase (AMP-forming)/AMP-acid ligase II